MSRNIPIRRHGTRGFTLVELMISMALLMILSSAAFLALNQNQKVYVTHSNTSSIYGQVRSAAELIAQEVGQAGSLCGASVSMPLTTIPPPPVACTGTTATAASGGSATLASVQGLFVGEKLIFDPDSSARESVAITQINGLNVNLNPPLTSTHNGAWVVAPGAFWQGVVLPTDVSPTGTVPYPVTVQTNYNETYLNLFGDLNGDGTLVYVKYNCDFTAHTLTRQVTTIDPVNSLSNTLGPADVLVDNLYWKAPLGYTGAQYCFSYTTLPTVTATDGHNYTVTTQIGLLISVRTPYPDPQTGGPLKLTKSFLNLSPRNVIAASDLANNNVTDSLQPAPYFFSPATNSTVSTTLGLPTSTNPPTQLNVQW